MKTTIVLCAITVLVGCASTTGVVAMGKDTYMISRSDNSPAASLGVIKAEALNEAGTYCAKTGNTYAVVGGYDVPRSLGQFPQTEVQFRCVAR